MDRVLRQARKGRLLDAAISMMVFGLSLGVYLATLAPGLSFHSMDGNELATVPYAMSLAHMPGYPLYTWLGKLFTLLPIGDVAFRMNLMSAVFAAAGVVLLYRIVRLLTGKVLPAAFAALIFAFSATLWSQAVITEVYALNVFMLALTMLLLLTWGVRQGESSGTGAGHSRRSWPYLVGFALCFGLSLGAHLSNLAFAPAFAVYIVLVNHRVLRRPWLLLAMGLAFLLGAAQFVWLPLRASTLRDALMVANSPDTLQGFYSYTLGAFGSVRFAFPVSALPERIGMYLGLLWQNFGPWGVFLLTLGIWEAATRHRRAACLLILAYLIQIAFFTQYDVSDVAVFFIPAHLIAAVFIGYGAFRGAELVRTLSAAWLARTLSAGRHGAIAAAALAVLLIVPPAAQVQANYVPNDQSSDTLVADFYSNVFEVLPPGSALLGWAGVSGYDMFYYRDVYDVRPDVLMPLAAPGRQQPLHGLQGAPHLYTTLDRGADIGQIMDDDDYLAPVMVAPTLGAQGPSLYLPGGMRSPEHPLRLYRVTDQPARLLVPNAEPEHLLNVDLGGVELVGYDLAQRAVQRGTTLHVVSYWRIQRPGTYLVATRLGESPYSEVHKLGFGNLDKLPLEEKMTLADRIVVEEYDLVIPSATPLGAQAFKVGLVDRTAPDGQYVEVAALTVIE